MTRGESQPNDDQAKAAHAPDTEEDTSLDDGATGARGPAVAGRVPDSSFQWRRVKLSDQPAGVQAEFLPEYAPHPVDRPQDATPLEIFTNIWTDNFLEFICKETKRYAQQKGNHRFTFDTKALIKFLGIRILSGYVQQPQRRMLWERGADTNNAAVKATCLETDF